MMEPSINNKMQVYQITVVFSVLFALIGFSYNVWRMEVSEENNNIRTASFELLLELSELEQLIYTAYYDKDIKEGSPRKGWVKVGLINDLSVLTSESVVNTSAELKSLWSSSWNEVESNKEVVDSLVKAIDAVRAEIKLLLSSLE